MLAQVGQDELSRTRPFGEGFVKIWSDCDAGLGQDPGRVNFLVLRFVLIE